MEGITCPLCCNQSFSSKQSLIDHCMTVLYNLSCSICNCKLSSISELLEHLSLANCESQNAEHTVVYVENGVLEENTDSNVDNINPPDTNTDQSETAKEHSSDYSVNNSEVNNMYVDLLKKSLPTPQTQELKIISNDGIDQYMFVTSNVDTSASMATEIKQDADDKVPIEPMAIETDLNTIETSNQMAAQTQETTYSCNTCGVTFTSVLEHIQNYHNDQDVVVEEALEMNNETIPTDFDPIGFEDLEKETPKRMITESGDIVDAPADVKTDHIQNNSLLVQQLEAVKLPINHSNVIGDSKPNLSNTGSKKYIKVDKFCDSFVKDIKKGKKPYCHKVVIKEMQILESGNKVKVKVFNCLACNVYVTTLDEFKERPCKVQYPCPHCSVVYDNSKSLCAHMKVHKGNTEAEQGVYKCDICTTTFPTNKSLKLHKRMHEPVKPRPIEPPLTLVSGEKVSKDKFLCSVCDKLIPMDYKTIHQNSHKFENKFNCDICNKKFESGEYLDMHMKVHSVEKVPVNKQNKPLPYNCLYCNRQFARPHEKVKHERIHTGEKPHSCEICGKSFRVSYCLTLHMRTHTGARPYACPHCHKRFKAHSVYNHHLQTHSDVRAYKCPYCPKAFKTQVQLAGHKNSHTKPFSCQHCNRPFATLYAVRVHSETHLRQNNLKFSCAQCGASYARTFALKDHMKQAHNRDLDADTVGNKNATDIKSEWIVSEDTAEKILENTEKENATDIKSEWIVSEDTAEKILKNTEKEGKTGIFILDVTGNHQTYEVET